MKIVLFRIIPIVMFAVFAMSCQKDSPVEPIIPADNLNADALTMVRNNGNQSSSASGSDECFDFIYPLVIVMPDGSTQSFDDIDALEDFIDDWFDNNPDAEEYPEFQYPLDVIFMGETVTVNDEPELCELLVACEDEEEDDEEEDDEDEDEDEDEEEDEDGDDEDCEDFDFEEECFDVVFPIQVQFPDGQVVDVNDEDELYDLVEEWFDNNPDAEEEPELVYPISVLLDDEEIEVNSDEELDELFELCEELYGEDEDEDEDDDDDDEDDEDEDEDEDDDEDDDADDDGN